MKTKTSPKPEEPEIELPKVNHVKVERKGLYVELETVRKKMDSFNKECQAEMVTIRQSYSE